MAINKERNDIAYLVGRLIAITEKYAGKHFGPGSIQEAYNHPQRLLEVFGRYIDQEDEYYQEVTGMLTEPIPITTKPMERTDMALGYYNQRSAYGGQRKNEQERLRMGERIATLRKEQGLTQEQLGEMCGILGNHITRIEKGRYSVGLDTLSAIAKALGKRIDFV